MSYFKGLTLTKKGEQLQARVNGNLSETLVFTKAKLGSGQITNDNETRFLTDLKASWGNAVVSSCEIQGQDKDTVAIELQFSNEGLREDKIFREIGLYARGNNGQEVLYAYANAGENYDYIPTMQNSPHTFIIVIYFKITSGTKISATIDLKSYITQEKFNVELAKKIDKSSISNSLTSTSTTTVLSSAGAKALEDKKIDKALRSDSVNSTSSENIATSLAVKTAYDKGVEALNTANTKLNKATKNTSLVGFENSGVGIYLGRDNQINFKIKGNSVNFGYSQIDGSEKIERYNFLNNGGGRDTYADIGAKDIYSNDSKVTTEADMIRHVGKNYGGILNTTGAKTAGKTYFDNNTKKLFLCKNNNSDTSANVANYIALDNNSLLERLENLIKVELLYSNSEITRVGVLIKEIPAWVKTLKILGGNINNNQVESCWGAIFLDIDTIRKTSKNTCYIDVGNAGDERRYGLTISNNSLNINSIYNVNDVGQNNYITKIYGLNF